MGKHITYLRTPDGNIKRQPDDPDFSRLQDEARSAKRGLWSDKSSTPPWVWRTIHS
jgi:endonuclease YncB( thermonuclease family)